MEMQESVDLRSVLRRIDGRGYRAYRDIEGMYRFEAFTLVVDHVQADPFAAPSRIRVRVPLSDTGFSPEFFRSHPRAVAFRDYLTRRVADAAGAGASRRRGSGGSGIIGIERPGQEILDRTSMLIDGTTLEARLVVGLPAQGRRVLGTEAESIFFNRLPAIVDRALFSRSINESDLIRHVEVAEDADALRKSLAGLGLVAFVADGAYLPRASGVDDRPLPADRAVAFRSPPSLRVSVTLPNRGGITGMGIREGVTLIVGGGYHGKSTLLRALETGIYNHIPGDGREFVVASPGAVKIRAEDGRRVEKVDISPFISNLPFGGDTTVFSTEDASGSTSQAANIMESLEAGADVLLIDEDTSATNFMIRDHRMQELVAREKEPITPFIDRVRSLHEERGVSTILVIGGSGDYFDVADTVICMEQYLPGDCTERAKAIAARYVTERKTEGERWDGEFMRRIPEAASFDPRRGRRDVKIAPKGKDAIAFGVHRIDLSAVEQIVDPGQTRALGDAIQYATRYMNGGATLAEVIARVDADIESHGLDLLSRRHAGDYAGFRPVDLAAAMNRLRTLRVTSSLPAGAKTGKEEEDPLTGPRSAHR